MSTNCRSRARNVRFYVLTVNVAVMIILSDRVTLTAGRVPKFVWGYQAAWDRAACWLAACSRWLMRWSRAVRSSAVNFQLNGRAVRL